MINVSEINELHAKTVAEWHDTPIENNYSGLLEIVCQQHSFNFLLWHEEDIARSRDVTDQKIAEVKRAIDGYNQNRNDWIERVDDHITQLLEEADIAPAINAPINTETPGSAMDRLSIMALRIYHLREQLERDDVDEKHIESVERKIAVCLMQQADLSKSLQTLIEDIFAGRKQHKTYRQFKMYNDPTLNPYLYKARKAG